MNNSYSKIPTKNEMEEIENKIKSLFNVESIFFKRGWGINKPLASFIINKTDNVKESFKEVHGFLKNYGLFPTLIEKEVNNVDDKNYAPLYILDIRILPKIKKNKNYINIILFAITLMTVSITGYFLSTSAPFLEVFPNSNPFLITFGFTIGLMSAIGLHELAHLIILKSRKLESSLPYFIPGIPIIGLPTFGAIIIQKTPPTNKDSLFDMGISGPIMNFIVSFIVLAVGIMLSKVLTPLEAQALIEKYPDLGPLPVPLLFIIMENLFFNTSTGVLYMHPIAYAGWLGLLITALNLFPIGQLDGGHALRSLISEKYAKYASYIATVVLMVLGYWLMGILVFLIGGFRNQGSLDDISPVTTSRKIIWVLSIILLVLSVTPFLIFI